MAVIQYVPAGASVGGTDPGVQLQAAQGGNADSTNIMDRGVLFGAGLLQIASVAGATPTVTVAILGSIDGVSYWNIAYALVATPETVAVGTFAITTTVTTNYILRPNHPWRFLKVNMSANTNVTLTTFAWSR